MSPQHKVSPQHKHIRMIGAREKNEQIYIVRERDIADLNLPIYKLGRTSRGIGERLAKYPKGSEVCFAIAFVNSTTAETFLLDVFCEKFVQQTDRGREYFWGDLGDMIDVIIRYWHTSKVITPELADFGARAPPLAPPLVTPVSPTEKSEVRVLRTITLTTDTAVYVSSKKLSFIVRETYNKHAREGCSSYTIPLPDVAVVDGLAIGEPCQYIISSVKAAPHSFSFATSIRVTHNIISTCVFIGNPGVTKIADCDVKKVTRLLPSGAIEKIKFILFGRPLGSATSVLGSYTQLKGTSNDTRVANTDFVLYFANTAKHRKELFARHVKKVQTVVRKIITDVQKYLT